MPLLDTIRFILAHPLNRGQKLNALLRFASWQISSRIVRRQVVFDWIHESRFLVRTKETGLTGNIYAGLQEFADMAFTLHVLRAEDLFIDVGANAGSYTILASKVAGARTHAFEPDPSGYGRLLENVRLNGLETRVVCHNIGIGGTLQRTPFVSGLDVTSHVLAPHERMDETIAVNLTTLDTVLAGKSPTMLKIDVEGYETPVIEGALETLGRRSLHAAIIELNGAGDRYGYSETRIIETMFDHGFRSYSYEPLSRTLVTLEGKNGASGNTLFVRDKPWVIERLRTAPKIRVLGTLI